VKTVVVAGELLMERGELKTVDEERVLHEVRQRAQRIARA